MKITRLYIRGCKKFQLNNIDSIDIAPQHSLQLVLGTNGSGKSTLLEEASPLPIDHRDFEKDGCKIIHLEHKSNNYILTCSVNTSNGNHYSFIKNDEELNPGGTITVYRTLVHQYFNITPDSHKLLIGKTRFSDMSVADRRSWFTKISDVDYTFAIRYFHKLKETQVHTQGALKSNQNRLVTESSKILSKEDQVKLKAELDSLKEMLDDAVAQKTIIPYQLAEGYNKLSKIDQQLRELYWTVMSNAKELRSSNTRTPDLLQEKLNSLQNKLSVNKALSERIGNSIEKNLKTQSLLEKTNLTEIKSIDQELTSIESSLNNAYAVLATDFQFPNVSLAIDQIDSIYDDLYHLLTDMPDNTDEKYTRLKYDTLLESISQSEKTLYVVNEEIAQMHSSIKALEHARDHNKTECPECQHKWSIGFDLNKYTLIKNRLETYLAKQLELKQSLEKLMSAKQDMQRYMEMMFSYRGIISKAKDCTSLFDYIQVKKMILEPRSILRLLDKVRVDLPIYLKIAELKNKEKQLLQVKELTKETQDSGISDIAKAIYAEEEELKVLVKDRRTLLETISQVQKYIESSKEINRAREALEGSLKLRESIVDEMRSIVFQEHINKLISLLKTEISTREHNLSAIETQSAIVVDIQKQIDYLTERLEIAKKTVSALSPSNGLIAKGLVGFINHFTNQVNLFIEKVWAYPLEITPIQILDDSVDLDYKFKISVDGKMTVPDISYASGAQREIIDIAFKIVSATYLGLSEAPLYLDEVGVKMDPGHRREMHRFISDLVSLSNFSQIFMVSHYESNYGSLTNCDTLVMCPVGIALPKDMPHNQHAVITYY